VSFLVLVGCLSLYQLGVFPCFSWVSFLVLVWCLFSCAGDSCVLVYCISLVLYCFLSNLCDFRRLVHGNCINLWLINTNLPHQSLPTSGYVYGCWRRRGGEFRILIRWKIMLCWGRWKKNVILDIFLLLKNNSCGVTRKLLLASTTSPIFESSFFCTHQYLAFHTKTITR